MKTNSSLVILECEEPVLRICDFTSCPPAGQCQNKHLEAALKAARTHLVFKQLREASLINFVYSSAFASLRQLI